MICLHKQAEEKSPSMRIDLNTSAYSYFDAGRRAPGYVALCRVCCLTQIGHSISCLEALRHPPSEKRSNYGSSWPFAVQLLAFATVKCCYVKGDPTLAIWVYQIQLHPQSFAELWRGIWLVTRVLASFMSAVDLDPCQMLKVGHARSAGTLMMGSFAPW